MKLLSGGSLMALVLISELVGLVVLARYKVSTEAHPPAQEGSFTIFDVRGGGGDYKCPK